MIAAVQDLALRVILILLGFEIARSLFFHFISRDSRSRPAATGREGLIGRKAVVRREFESDPDGRWIGKVALGAELWHAVLVGGGALQRGEEVEVEAIEGLTLHVRAAEACGPP